VFDFLMGYVMGERSAARAATFARSAGATAASGDTQAMEDVNERVDRLILVVDALWSMLRESGWTDEQLAQRIHEIDLSDGLADGRRTPQARRCTSCDAMIEAGRSACAFCGKPVEGEAPVALDGI
jgi:hypothetical protein